MITRIVKMTLQQATKEAFTRLFNQSRPHILTFEGCHSVEMKSLSADPDTVFTLSRWENEDDLELYRNSEFFIQTWRAVKPLFAAKAEAWTLIDE
jgi:quinol monooxygenase YgiN